MTVLHHGSMAKHHPNPVFDHGSMAKHHPKGLQATGDTRKRSCPSLEENESKRAKIDESNSVVPHLPQELWAKTLEYLEYSDVMQCTAVSPAFLREILPKVETLFINQTKQVDPRQTERFKTGCVKSIFIVCYTLSSLDDVNRGLRLMYQCLVPFLQQFSQLEYLFLGGILPHSDDATTTVRKHSPTGVCFRNALRACREYSAWGAMFTRAASAAFKFGLFPKDLTIDGGFAAHVSPCGDIHGSQRGCAACHAVCEHCPMPLVWNTALCIGYDQRIEILLRREGGAEFLRNTERLLPVVRYVLRECGPFGVSTNHVFQGIRRLVELGCNPRDVSREQLLASLEPIRLPHRPETVVRSLVSFGFNIEEEDMFFVFPGFLQ
jgi:hypothetical protein